MIPPGVVFSASKDRLNRKEIRKEAETKDVIVFRLDLESVMDDSTSSFLDRDSSIDYFRVFCSETRGLKSMAILRVMLYYFSCLLFSRSNSKTEANGRSCSNETQRRAVFANSTCGGVERWCRRRYDQLRCPSFDDEGCLGGCWASTRGEAKKYDGVDLLG